MLLSTTEWAEEILAAHVDDISPADVTLARSLIDDGDGWLAAYDLLGSGADEGWLTAAEAETALAFARAGKFGKFSAGAENDARSVLAS
ncbi:hypothetical protein GSI01S_01_03010 [Gordonia sihwensis NBRC 108236]|uniref:Uncharacterized protein n=1 Tax=Gordonia sihwensis NBRC 108236 TaxID=1223544 RepID=L7LEJ5_9ACTN|nr:hypothetical protein GSI01S_01_03010 [Gordonia sihwensis NBRC 108236]